MLNLFIVYYFKKIVVYLTLTFLFLLIISFFFLRTYSGHLAQVEETGIQYFIHRGGGKDMPDNSLMSVKYAIEKGVNNIDLDIRLTKDKKIVAFHDESLDRLTNGNGKIRELNYEDIAKYHYVFPEGKPTEKDTVHLLEDFFMLANATTTYSLEFKTNFFDSIEMATVLRELLKKYNLENRTYLSSFDVANIAILNYFFSKTSIILNISDRQLGINDGIKSFFVPDNQYSRIFWINILQPDIVSFEKKVDIDFIKRISQRGYPIKVWDIYKLKNLEKFSDIPLYGVVLDNTKLFISLKSSSATSSLLDK